MNAIKKQKKEKHDKSVKMWTIDHNQVLKEVRNKQDKIFALKDRRIFKLDKYLEDDIASEAKDRKR